MSLTSLLNGLQPSNPLAGFLICNEDTATTTIYYGYMSMQGAWYIMKQDTTVANATSYQYAFGSSGYTAAWTDRASQTFTYPNGN